MTGSNAIDRFELKRSAKLQLKGKLGLIIGAFLLETVILAVVSWTVIGVPILSGPLAVGFAGILLKTVRNEEATISNLFDGFQQFVNALVAALLMGIFTMLWTLLLVIPGIIAVLRYSQTFYILRDNPDMDGFTALRKSGEMMRGHKGELAVLYLSFIGWYIVAGLTFGIALLWVGPYVSVTMANFYEEVKAGRS